MEHSTFTDSAVIRGAVGFVRMRADMTAESPANQALMKQFGVQGVPTTLFIDRAGHVRERHVGYIGASQFVKLLRATD
jgi:thiol:disulfide interchange protein DsbD